MSTNGAITFVSGGVEKSTYNHSDSYPTWLGVQVADWLRSETFDLATARIQVDALRMVPEDGEPTAEERERFAEYHEKVSTDRDWYAQLRGMQGHPGLILTAGVACDSDGFEHDPACEWRYVIDLDAEELRIHRGDKVVIAWTFAEMAVSTTSNYTVMVEAQSGGRS